MRVVMFYHSLVSDWNHGNAHFLRGVASEMISRGFDVRIFEPHNSWSRLNLVKDYGEAAISAFHNAYPSLSSTRYDLAHLNLDDALKGADLVIVHEWNDPGLIGRLGEHKAHTDSYKLLFHDTHHRSVSEREEISSLDLSNYCGVLAFGQVIRDVYFAEGLTSQAWIWHEAADTRVFDPRVRDSRMPFYDVVWIGNWGDGERTAELYEYLIDPVRELGLAAVVYGVRFPEEAVAELQQAGIEYRGWLPNFSVPEAFAQARFTVHIPRRPYVESLPGIPTIRPFEALACGIPLISAYWDDSENLFIPGEDFLVVHNGDEMKAAMERLLENDSIGVALAQHGLRTVRSRHTCSHRVDQLMSIYEELNSQTETLKKERAAVL